MPTPDDYRRKAETILRLAAEAHDIKTRGYLIEEALYWHRLACEASGIRPATLHDNDDDAASDAEANG